ncbi:MAG: hypothetical protein KC466_00905 [Myxococcales bacterium]|nr:hypothetical protein [Myxococcales bacterium]
MAFTLAAYVVIGALIAGRTGVADPVYVDYYRGNEAIGVYGKTYAELLETTHFHLFSYPLFLLLQGHIFLLTSWNARLKAALVIAAFVGAALYLAAPWLVLFAGPGFAWVKSAGRALLGIPLILFAVVPIYEMWFRRT